MRLSQALAAFACALAAAAAIAGCGGGSDASTATSSSAAKSRPAPAASDFPSAKGKTLGEVLEAEGAQPSKLVVSPAAEVFRTGKNRYPFGVFQRDRTQVSDAEIALYFARVPQSKNAQPGTTAAKNAEKRALDEPAIGPFPAYVETLQTKPAYRAKTTVSDPDAATVVYATHVDFPSKGEWRIAALIKQGSELSATLLPSAQVGAFSKVPTVGQKAPFMHTPTAADVHGDLAKITTRIPPDSQNKVDYADVLGKEPIVLTFRDSPVLPEPRLRPGRRRGRAAQAAPTATRLPSSTWRSTRTTIRTRACARRCAPTTCPASRGCSRSAEMEGSRMRSTAHSASKN